MYPNDTISARRAQLGVTVKALAERAGLNYHLACRGMNSERQFTAAEFIRICKVLDLTLEDFEEREEF